jgi:hypothetical protein
MTIESEGAEVTVRRRGARRSREEEGSGSAVEDLAKRLNLDDPDLAAESALQSVDGGNGNNGDGNPEDAPTDPRQRPPAPPSSDDQPLDDDVASAMSPDMQRVLTMNPTAAVRPPSKKEQREARAIEKDSRKIPPSAKQFGDIGRKLPGSEHVKVHKRKPNGELAYVGEYNLNDLTQSQDLESFLYRYVAPEFGPGEYQIRAVNVRGMEIDAGIITIAGPEQKPEKPVELSPLELLREQLMNRDRDIREMRTRQSQQTEKDPLDVALKLHDLNKKMSEGSGKEDGTLGALISTMGQQSTSMMQMMMQMQQRSDERMESLFERSKQTDPIMLTLLTKLLDDKGSGTAALPPMLPPVDPIQQMKALAETMALLQPKRDEGAELIKYMLSRADNDRLSTKDLLEILDKARGGGGPGSPDDFKKTVENFSVFMQLAKSLNGEGGSAAVDIVSALANSRLPDSIAGFFKARGAGGAAAPRQLPANTPQDEELRQRERAVRERQIRIAEERTALLEQELQKQRDAGAPAVAAVPGVPAAPVLQPVPEVAAQPVVAEQQVAAPAAAAAPAPAGPMLPPKIGDHVNNILEAGDDDDQLTESAVDMIIYLTEPEAGGLKKYGDHIVALVLRGDGPGALEYVRALFAGLSKLGLMDESLCTRICSAFEANFEAVAEYVQESLSEEEGEDGGEEAGADA